MKQIEVVGFVEKITYKPGWTVHIERNYRNNGWWVTFETPRFHNATGVGEAVMSRLNKGLLDWTVGAFDEDHLVLWILEQIEIMERHETNEWFRISGKHYRTPHPEKWRESV